MRLIPFVRSTHQNDRSHLNAGHYRTESQMPRHVHFVKPPNNAPIKTGQLVLRAVTPVVR